MKYRDSVLIIILKRKKANRAGTMSGNKCTIKIGNGNLPAALECEKASNDSLNFVNKLQREDVTWIE